MKLQEKFYNYLEVNTNYAIPTIEKWSKNFTLMADEMQVFAIGELHMMGVAYVNSKDKKEENVEAWVNRMIAKKPIKYRGKGMIIKLEVQHE